MYTYIYIYGEREREMEMERERERYHCTHVHIYYQTVTTICASEPLCAMVTTDSAGPFGMNMSSTELDLFMLFSCLLFVV